MMTKSGCQRSSRPGSYRSCRSIPQVFELITHRRVDAGVRTANLMAGFRCQPGDTAHEGAGDAENVKPHYETRSNTSTSSIEVSIQLAMVYSTPAPNLVSNVSLKM